MILYQKFTHGEYLLIDFIAPHTWGFVVTKVILKGGNSYMGYILCTAEKPSVAREIASCVGASVLKKGYYEGNGYRVTWAVGHLVGLAEPEEYGYVSLKQIWDKENKDYKQKALQELPLIPKQFKLVILEKTEEQFYVIKSLMNDADCDYIIDCGDSGAEGHILQWFIRVMAGCNKPVKRFIAQSYTEEAINEAMNNLQDIKKYIPIIIGEYCKKKADWILGMSISRGASITYEAKIDSGRVQSPTLFFVVKRYIDVMNFKPIDYYTFKAECVDGFNVYWQKDMQNIISPIHKDTENRLLNKTIAEKLLFEIKSIGQGAITRLETKNKSTDRPQLYDITELERDGNRIFNYTADQVLKAAQSLYETHKVTTYPRTDSRYITHDLIPLMNDRINDISTLESYKEAGSILLSKGLNIDGRIMDDSKVTDHHAIIVTNKIRNFNLSSLSEIEFNILNLVIVRMMVALSEKYKYKETVIDITFSNGITFSASGRIPISLGWKDVQNNLLGKTESEEDVQNEDTQLFSNVCLGQIISMKNINMISKKTIPPKLHTEATLLTAMESAGSKIEGGEILKDKGIGTQATRAEIIKSLFEKGYIKNLPKSKVNYLVPSKQGISIIKVLPPELYSPKITADWENQIADIVSGKITEKDFMNNFESFINDMLKKLLSQKIKDVDFSMDSLGKCPWCGSPVLEGTFKDKDNKKVESAYCTNKACKFSIRKDNLIFKLRTGRNISIPQIKTFITGGTVETKCVSKSNTSYTGSFNIIKNESGYAEIVFSMPKTKPKVKRKRV